MDIIPEKCEIYSIFCDSQSPSKHKELVIKLLELFKKTTDNEFATKFWWSTKILLIHQTSKFLDSMSAFIGSFLSHETFLVQDGDSELLSSFSINILIKLSNLYSRKVHVRYNICNLIHHILLKLSCDVYIDDNLFDKLLDSLSERLLDRSAKVRRGAIKALCKMQGSDEDCPVVRQFLFLLKNDPDEKTRLTVLESLIDSVHVLETVVEKTRDISPLVRKAAFQFIMERVSLHQLPLEYREQIIKTGFLKDSSFSELLQTKAIPEMYECAGNLTSFMEYFDILHDYEIPSKALESLFVHLPSDQTQDWITRHLNSHNVIPFADLSLENAFIWYHIIRHIHSKLGTLKNLQPNISALLELGDNLLSAASEVQKRENSCFKLQELLKLIKYFHLTEDDRNFIKEKLSNVLQEYGAITFSILKEVIKVFILMTDRQLQSSVVLGIIKLLHHQDQLNNRMIILKIIYEFAQGEESTIQSEFLEFVEQILLDSLQSKVCNEVVLAVKALGAMCCLNRKDIALKYYALFMLKAKLEKGKILSTTLAALIDLVTYYDLETFHDVTEEHELQPFLDLLVEMTVHDYEEVKFVAIKGCLKLLVKGYSSAQLVSNLLLLVFSSLNDPSSTLMWDVPKFLIEYVKTVRGLGVVKESIWPAFKNLLESPATSLLHGINVVSAGKIMVSIIQHEPEPNHVQTYFALKICEYLEENISTGSLSDGCLDDLSCVLNLIDYQPGHKSSLVALLHKCDIIIEELLNGTQDKFFKRWRKKLILAIQRPDVTDVP